MEYKKSSTILKTIKMPEVCLTLFSISDEVRGTDDKNRQLIEKKLHIQLKITLSINL